MSTILNTIMYFFTWGIAYGLILAVWSTTLILPGFGSMFGGIWGTGIGAACGLLCGVIVAVIQFFTFHEDVDLNQYRRRLSAGIGLLVGVVAPIMLLATSKGLLWADYEGGAIPLRIYLVQCLVAASFWGALSSAYVASLYPAWLVRLKTDFAHIIDSLPPIGLTITLKLLKTAFNWPTLIAAALAGLAYRLAAMMRDPSYSRGILAEAGIAMGGGLLVFVIVLLALALGAGAFLFFIKHLFFLESSSSERTRRLMTLAAAGFVGGICIVRGAGFLTGIWPLLIPWPILIGIATYRAFPSFAGTPDKAKRKEKNALALDETTARDGVDETLDEEPQQELRA